MKMKTICLHKYEISIFCSCRGSNPGPWAHKTHALPTELHERKKVCILGDSNPGSFTQQNLSLPPLTTRKNADCSGISFTI